jgi:hypothetical protein
MPRTKSCSKCLVEKDLSEFFAEKRAADGRRYSCKVCDNLRRDAYLLDMSVEQLVARKINRKKHGETERKYSTNRRNLYRGKALIYLAKKRAAKRSLPFNLDDKAAQIQKRIDAGTCELTGIPFRLDESRSFDSPSIDRIVPSRGYIYSNIRIVCYGVNCALGTWGEAVTVEMMRRWIETIDAPVNPLYPPSYEIKTPTPYRS